MITAKKLRHGLADRFRDELRFLRGWRADAKSVGAILPTSRFTSRAMASLVDTASGLPVLEIGPGTGVVTRAILARGVAPENLWCVEYSPEFTRHLQARFPDCHIVHGDAFALEKVLPPPSDMRFDCVISGLPLLNFTVPQRVALIEDWLERVPFGRPVVQFTYGPRSPLPPGLGNYIAHHHTLVLRNVPPANVWTYRRRLQ